MSVVVSNISKTYGNQKALDNISFEAKKGQILGFLGPNGAGKSTTLKIITGYMQPTSGIVQIGGIEINIQQIEVKKKIGYLPENNPLYPQMYVKEFLEYSALAYGIKKNEAIKNATVCIEKVGLVPEMHKKIGQLSKGYKQRVGLAQAILHQPEVLVLDEPTNGFDPNQLLDIRKLIKEEAQNKTVIFSTHIMQEVQNLCDQVVVINKGKIVANESIENFKQHINNDLKIEVKFSKPIDTKLLQHQHITQISENGTNAYVISSVEDVRSFIIRLATTHDWGILEIKIAEEPLENIFKHLTGSSS